VEDLDEPVLSGLGHCVTDFCVNVVEGLRREDDRVVQVSMWFPI
jgi:hypothetical protein